MHDIDVKSFMNDVLSSAVPSYDMALGLLAGPSHEESARLVHHPTAPCRDISRARFYLTPVERCLVPGGHGQFFMWPSRHFEDARVYGVVCVVPLPDDGPSSVHSGTL